MSTTKNFTIITFIAIFGLSLFLIFFNLLSTELTQLPNTAALDSTTLVSTSSSSLASSSSSISSQISTSTKPSISSTSSASIAPVAPVFSYKDGVYSAASNYGVPGGSESINVSITVKSDQVSDVAVTNSGGDRESRQYQNRFASSIKASTVGKKISDLSLSRVGGASLTTSGFIKALNSIKAQAKS